MSLIYNDVSYAFNTTKPLELMDIHKFIDTFQYSIDKLYVDKFWNGLRRVEWVLVDYPLLRWMGYKQARERDNHAEYLNMLRHNFNEEDHFYIASKSDIEKRGGKPAQRNTIVVRLRVFKKTLMMLRTHKANDVRDYFISVDDLMIDYVDYTQAVKDHNACLIKAVDAAKIKALEDKLAQTNITFEVSAPEVPNEFVYILTNKRYFKMHMFKIGKSINTKSRLISFNTSSALAIDDMYYVAAIPTFDGSGLEKLLHRALHGYHYRKEWFHIPHQHMHTIIKLATMQQRDLAKSITDLFQGGFDNIVDMQQEHIGNLDYQLPIAEPYPRLKHMPDALTKLNDIKAIYPELTTKKLLNINGAFTSRQIHMCRLCNERHHKNCCNDSTTAHRVKRTIIDNISIIN